MLREKYLEGIEELERWYVFDGVNDEILKIIPLIRNGKFLLLGPYGFGKSLYSYLVGRIFFGYDPEDMPVVQLMDELTVYDVFFHIHVAELMKGEEKIEPRSIVTSPFKFVNEFQRGNYRVYNTFLGLFSEGFVSLRDKKFHTEDYVAILDANPFDAGSVEVPRALMDRITGAVNIRSMPPERIFDMLPSTPDIKKVRSVLNARDMKKIWDDEKRIEFGEHQRLVLMLLHSYFSSCKYGDRAVMNPRYVANLCSTCMYRTEPCSAIREPLGHRWWKDAASIARARAYINGRKSVSTDDVFFGSFYALQHRLNLRESAKTLYPSSEHWLKNAMENAKRRLKSVWIPALKGDEKAYQKDERTLAGMIADD